MRLVPRRATSVLAALAFLPAALCLVACDSSPEVSFGDMAMPDLTAPTDGSVDAAVLPPDLGSTFLDIPASMFETWQYRDVGGYTCGDGSEGGVLANLTTKSRRLLVFFDGRGACWDADGCIGDQPSAYLGPVNQGVIDTWMGAHGFSGDLKSGIFDRGDANNPFRDDNWVYLIDCAGDAFWGNNLWPYTLANGKTSNVFHFGFQNYGVLLSRLTTSFADAPRLVLGGIGTGGMGALGNYLQTANAFAAIKGPQPILVDDSGPVLSFGYLPQSVQTTFQTAWGLNGSVASACPKCDPQTGTGYEGLWSALGTQFTGMRGALLSSYQDATSTQLYSALNADPQFDGTKLQAGLTDFSMTLDTLAASIAPSQLHVYYAAGRGHGALTSAPLSGPVLDFLNKELSADPSWKSVQ